MLNATFSMIFKHCDLLKIGHCNTLLETLQCQGLNKPWPASSLRWKSTRFRTFFFAGYASNFFNTTKVGHERNSVALSTLALCLSGTSIKMTLGSELRTNGTFFRPIYEVTMSITVQDYWWSQMSIGTTNFCWYTAHCLKISQNVSFWICQFWHFPPIFVLSKLTCLGTLFDRKLQVF